MSVCSHSWRTAGPCILPLPVRAPRGRARFETAMVPNQQNPLGLAWQATEQDFETASAFGVNIDRAVASNFFLRSAVAGAAGVLTGFYYNSAYPTMGSVPAYKAMAIALMGGLDNAWGTVNASLILGIVETFLVTSPPALGVQNPQRRGTADIGNQTGFHGESQASPGG